MTGLIPDITANTRYINFWQHQALNQHHPLVHRSAASAGAIVNLLPVSKLKTQSDGG
ncbi:MAG: hypothetical protein AB8B97_19695 [Granulosicoccus sp.]